MGAANIEISGFDQVGITPPEGRTDATGHLTDALSYITGRHEMKFGGEFRQGRVDEFYFRASTGNSISTEPGSLGRGLRCQPHSRLRLQHAGAGRFLSRRRQQILHRRWKRGAESGREWMGFLRTRQLASHPQAEYQLWTALGVLRSAAQR